MDTSSLNIAVSIECDARVHNAISSASGDIIDAADDNQHELFVCVSLCTNNVNQSKMVVAMCV